VLREAAALPRSLLRAASQFHSPGGRPQHDTRQL
jgi:hypothetical protein